MYGSAHGVLDCMVGFEVCIVTMIWTTLDCVMDYLSLDRCSGTATILKHIWKRDCELARSVNLMFMVLLVVFVVSAYRMSLQGLVHYLIVATSGAQPSSYLDASPITLPWIFVALPSKHISIFSFNNDVELPQRSFSTQHPLDKQHIFTEARHNPAERLPVTLLQILHPCPRLCKEHCAK